MTGGSLMQKNEKRKYRYLKLEIIVRLM